MITVVTGGAGFIGSNLVRKLLDRGRQVLVADDFSRGSIQNFKDLNIQPSDISGSTVYPVIDLKHFSNTLKITQGADTVFHLAARVGSINYLHGTDHNELEALLSNLVIDANVFRACIENGVKKLVYASSTAVYPIDLQNSYNVILPESSLRYYNPEGGYGWSKLLGEIELPWIKDIDIGIARIFNVYGENSFAGENPHAIVDLCRKVIKYPEVPFIVWGSGKQSRDFLHVSDCTNALLKLEEKASNPPVIVNIGSGKTVTVETLAQNIIAISGKNIKISYDTSKPVGPLSRTAEISKSIELLGWRPIITLDEGLKRTYTWLEKRLKLQDR
jgi:nucleoside-diphosphate-sugar epimerase